MPNIIYNKTNIKSWEDELPELNRQIEANTNIIAAQTTILTPLLTQSMALQSDINSTRTLIDQVDLADARKSSHQHSHSDSTTHTHEHPAPQSGWTTVVAVATEVSRAVLVSKLNSLTSDRYDLEGRIQSLRAMIASSKAAMDSAKTHKQRLVEDMTEGKLFLWAMENNPSVLLKQLKDNIELSFSDYDDKHPAGRSSQVRICLYDNLNKINAFELKDKRETQVEYLKLCGFLRDMRHQVSEENLDAEFVELLTKLLDQTHIDSDLPDDFKTDESAEVQFAKVKKARPALFAMTVQELNQAEQLIHNQQLDYMRRPKVKLDALLVKINYAVNLIQLEVQCKIQKNEVVDYHFYNRALNDLRLVSDNPKDIKAAQHLALLANIATGLPSLCNKALGGLVAVVGLLLIAASIAALGATFGGSSLASAFGVTLGLSLVQSQVTLCVGFSVGAATGIGLTFWGANKFQSGMRQGLSKEFNDINREVQAANPVGLGVTA